MNTSSDYTKFISSSPAFPASPAFFNQFNMVLSLVISNFKTEIKQKYIVVSFSHNIINIHTYNNKSRPISFQVSFLS